MRYSHRVGFAISPFSAGHFPCLPSGLYAVDVGNGSRFEVWQERRRGDILIGILGCGAYAFTHPHASGYLFEKLGFKHISDANNFADYLSCQFGVVPGTLPNTGTRQGSYHVERDLLREEVGRITPFFAETMWELTMPSLEGRKEYQGVFSELYMAQAEALEQNKVPAFEHLPNI